MRVCGLLGHDFVFTASGTTMRWECRRGCGAGGSKTYPTSAEADRYAAAFNAERDRPKGERGPLIALLPLRVFARLRRRSGDSG